jgi:uncharacterized protein (TIGR03435 family)
MIRAAVVCCFLLSRLASGQPTAQVRLESGVTPPKFEVASVKLAGPVNPGTGPVRSTGFREVIDNSHVRFSNVTLKWLVARAFSTEEYLVGGPGWIDSEHYDIVAKVPEDRSTKDLPLMLQELLRERFHLVVEHDSKPQRVISWK